MAARHVVVVGGGIVGSSTAFYLKRKGVDVTILEATSIAAGASGKAGGFLALDWHGPATESLAALSYKLHQDLAKEFGREATGYRELQTISLQLDTTNNKGKKVPGAEWINPDAVRGSHKLGDTDTTAQVHPRLLTTLLAKEVGKVSIGQAERIDFQDGKVQAVIARMRDGTEQRLSCSDVVIATGPWTGKVMKKLFGNDPDIDVSDYDISGSRAHSIVVRSSEPLSAHALFTSIKTGRKTAEPELYARPDGTGYICGPADDEPIPERADEVKVDPAAIARLKAEAVIISPTALGEKAVVEAEQACYLPISRGTGSPILAKLKEGVYFAAGHSCWGILQGPATGLAMSELIVDDAVSCCNVSMLTP